MKTAMIILALAALVGCVIVPVDSVYDQPPTGYDGGYGPPPLVLQAPPEVIVMPDTDDVYVVPDVSVELFFWNGWWWRQWDGRWYRSHSYDRGWTHYSSVPTFYYDVDPDWRHRYRNRDWYGYRWNYERIPNQRLQQNWKYWHDSRHWERQRTWGVQGYKTAPEQRRQELRLQRQKEYQQRPEVQRYQQQQQSTSQKQESQRQQQLEQQRRQELQRQQQAEQQRKQQLEEQRKQDLQKQRQIEQQRKQELQDQQRKKKGTEEQRKQESQRQEQERQREGEPQHQDTEAGREGGDRGHRK